jgi:S-layer protein (TIGR01567 family)
MRSICLISVTEVFFILVMMMSVNASDTSVEVRGQVFNLGQNEASFDNETFAGFYYDIDDNIGAEKLTLKLSNIDSAKASAILSDQPNANGNRGVVYSTQAQPLGFSFAPWGQYEVIGFLGDGYFAAYDNNVTEDISNANEAVPFLFDKSKNRNMMTNEQISKILVDDDTEQTITSTNPLKLEEGYQLDIKSIDIDGNKAYLDLSKNGQVVDSKVIQPSVSNAKMGDKTYYYKVDLGDTKEIIQIAVHFKNAFRGSDTNIATIDGIFQISDKPIALKSEQQYDKMSIRNVNPTSMAITMDNKDNQITLSKNKDRVLMQNISIKTSDQDDITAADPLRYYIYKKYIEPGTYELRGSVANLGANEFAWTNETFSGFYYDIDNNVGTEKLTFKLSDINPESGTLSDQPDANGNRGVVYTTQAQPLGFSFAPWGQYEVIGFLGDGYFVAYDGDITEDMLNANETVPILFDKSKNRNLMTNEQISKILLDDDTEQTITSASPLKLEEGYQLAIKNVDVKGNKAYLELSKDGQVVDSKVVQPSIDNARMSDKTYYYKVDLGDTKEIVQIAVHFKNAFAGSDTNIATVDGVFQISDTVTPLKSEQQYDKMSIRNVNPTDYSIIMDNKDNQVTLSKNKDVILMQNVHIKTADQDTIDATIPLRYYIYKAATIESANVTAPAEASAAATTVAPADNVITAAKTAAENVTKAATTTVEGSVAGAEGASKKIVNETANKTAAAAKNATATKTPGFEGIFAITGLLDVGYFAKGGKQ